MIIVTAVGYFYKVARPTYNNMRNGAGLALIIYVAGTGFQSGAGQRSEESENPL
jgi:hypothetical protein